MKTILLPSVFLTATSLFLQAFNDEEQVREVNHIHSMLAVMNQSHLKK